MSQSLVQSIARSDSRTLEQDDVWRSFAGETSAECVDVPRWYFRRRRIMCACIGVAMMVIYTHRVGISTAATDSSSRGGATTMVTEYGWTSSQQGVLLGAFYVGYAALQVPAAVLIRRWGAKAVLAVGVLWSSIFTLLTPLASDQSFVLAVACRVLCGFGQSPEYPAGCMLIADWAPPLERAQLVSAAMSGAYMGTLLGWPLSAFMLTTLGWRMIFYVFGGVGVVYALFFFKVVRDTPRSDERIHPSELHFILVSQQGPKTEDSSTNPPLAPVGEVLKRAICHPAIWALIFATIANNFGFYVLLSELPTFLHDVLGLSDDDAGLVGIVPYVLLWGAAMGSGFLADWQVRQGTLKLVNVRRLFFFVAEVPTGCLLVAAGYAPTELAVACLCIAVGFNGFYNSAFSANVIDVSGQYTSAVFALCNCIGQIPGMVSSPIIGALVQSMGHTQGFRIAFWVCLGLYIFGVAVFAVFSQARPFMDTGDAVSIILSGCNADVRRVE